MQEKILKLLDYSLVPLRTNVVFVCTMFVLGVISDIFVIYRGSRLLGLVELWLDIYVLAVMLTLLPLKVRSIVRTILYILFYTLALIDAYLYYAVGQPITPQIVTLLALTDIREAKEAVNVYVSFKPFVSPWTLIWIVLITHIFINKKKINGKLLNKPCPFLSIIVIFSIIVSIVLVREDKIYKYYRLLLGKNELETQQIKDLNPKIYYKQPIYRLIISLREYNRHRNINKELIKNINYGVVDTCMFTSPQIVLIIGESYNKHHSQLFGYDKKTTPNQLEYKNKGNLVVFPDAISSWNTTCESLQNIFSTSFYGDTSYWYEKPFFTTLFRKAGYDVHFLSNQYILDVQNSFSDYIEDIFVNLPNVSEVQFTSRNTKRHDYDEGLLVDYENIKSDSVPNLLIFHFIGSHFDFKERYPESEYCYKPEDYNRPDLNIDELEILAHYDNSLRYNDKVLGEIIKRFKNKPAIIIHVPDHGERVYDYDNGFGRSLGNTYSEISQQFDIPMWIWCSDEYKKLNPDIWKIITNNSDLPYMTDAISHTLLGLAGIKTSYYVPEMDILSPLYDKNRERIIKHSVDYDEIICKSKLISYD